MLGKISQVFGLEDILYVGVACDFKKTLQPAQAFRLLKSGLRRRDYRGGRKTKAEW